MIIRPFEQIALINFASRGSKFLRLFRHSDHQRFFFFDILRIGVFADIFGY